MGTYRRPLWPRHTPLCTYTYNIVTRISKKGKLTSMDVLPKNDEKKSINKTYQLSKRIPLPVNIFFSSVTATYTLVSKAAIENFCLDNDYFSFYGDPKVFFRVNLPSFLAGGLLVFVFN